MAAIGYGRFADPKFDLGIQDDVKIPISITPLTAQFHPSGPNTISANLQPPSTGDIRIVMQQKGSDGQIRRSWPGGPPNGKSVGKVLTLHASQGKADLPIKVDYDRVIWSGLSWAVGEIRHDKFSESKSITIQCSSAEKDKMMLDCKVYAIQYAK